MRNTWKQIQKFMDFKKRGKQEGNDKAMRRQDKKIESVIRKKWEGERKGKWKRVEKDATCNGNENNGNEIVGKQSEEECEVAKE